MSLLFWIWHLAVGGPPRHPMYTRQVLFQMCLGRKMNEAGTERSLRFQVPFTARKHSGNALMPWNPQEPFLKAAPNHPAPIWAKTPIAFNCWGRNMLRIADLSTRLSIQNLSSTNKVIVWLFVQNQAGAALFSGSPNVQSPFRG